MIPLLVSLLALPLLAGCAYLFDPWGYNTFTIGGGSFDPGDPFDPDASFDLEDALPVPSTVYRTGSLTLTLEGQPPIAMTLREGGAFDEFGPSAAWTDGAGWYVSLTGFSAAMPGPMADDGWWVSIDRIADARHFAASGMDCRVAATGTAAAGMSGTTTCAALVWRDATTLLPVSRPSASPPAFPSKASITFSFGP